MSRLSQTLVVFALAAGLPLAAQIRSARISGSVTDPTGLGIPDASVVVKETNTNQSYSVATNAAGEFTVPYLPPGSYEVIVEKSGFAPAKQSDIALSVAQNVRLEFTLKVASVQATVEVSASAASIQTESAAVQGATPERMIQALPNLNHNPLYYVTLQMGATPRASMLQVSGQNSFGIGINGRRQVSAFSINGGGAFQNDVQVDGVGVVGSAWNEAAVLPSTEGLQEVRTTVNNYSAEYGRGQGVIMMTTKSGTNELHGSVFWRQRNEALNANSFGNNARGIARQPFKVATYGGTAGGPFIKDKLFGFVSYEGLRFNEGLVFLRTVPTELEKRGDFSRTFANVGGRPVPLQVYDPYVVNAVGPNVYERIPFPNSVIPASRLYKPSLDLVSNYPAPNRTPDDAFNANNFSRRGIRKYERNILGSRVDYRPNSSHAVYFTGGFTFGDITNPLTWGDKILYNSAAGEQFAPFISDRNPYLSIGDTWIVSSSFVIDIRYGVNRIKTGSLAHDTPDFDYRAAGIPAEIEAAMAVRRLPNFMNGNYWSALNNNQYMHKDERQTNHVLAGSATVTRGRWTFKFGGETRQNFSNYTDAQEAISYGLVSTYTAGPTVNATGALTQAVTADKNGHTYASYLMGAAHLVIGRGFNAKPAFLQQYFALYTQNDWRPTNRLTLNFGLRWDAQPGVMDRFNRISSFDASATNPYGTPGAFYFPGSTGPDRRLWASDWRNFGPRLGAAYRLRENLVLRGGYGMTYLPSNTGFFNGPYNYGMQSFAPYVDVQPWGPSPAGVLVGNYSRISFLVQPTRDDPKAPGLYGGSPTPRFPRNGYVTPRVQQANFFIEWKKAGWQFATGWSGSYGRRMPLSSQPINSNQFLPAATLAAWRENYIARNGSGHTGSDLVNNPWQPAGGALIPFSGTLGNAKISLRETLLPYPFFGSMNVQRMDGFSDYNALQFQVTRSFSRGLLLNAHYTWSRALEVSNAEAQNNFGGEGFGFQGGDLINLSNNRRLSPNDIPHRAVINALYELPFGKGHTLNPSNRFLSGLMSGWQVSGVWIYQKGTPLVVTGANSNSLNGRPHALPGVPRVLPKELQGWYDGKTTVTLPSGRVIRPNAFSYLKYNPDAFAGQTVVVANGSRQRDIFWWGTAAFTYNDIRNEPLNNVNFSIQRTFAISERFRLDLQAHAHNFLNHTQFSPSYSTGLGNTEIVTNLANGQLAGAGQSAAFGAHGLSTYDARNIEIVLKLRF